MVSSILSYHPFNYLTTNFLAVQKMSRSWKMTVDYNKINQVVGQIATNVPDVLSFLKQNKIPWNWACSSLYIKCLGVFYYIYQLLNTTESRKLSPDRLAIFFNWLAPKLWESSWPLSETNLQGFEYTLQNIVLILYFDDITQSELDEVSSSYCRCLDNI